MTGPSCLLIKSENGVSTFKYGGRGSAPSMRIRFRKILPDGRSVRFEKEQDTLTLNVIVWRDRARRG